MTQEYAPIDFMEGQFVVLDGFQRIPRRRVSKVIRGCGAPMGSLTSKKSAPVRFLVGDGFHDMERSGDFAVEVDGVVLGHVRDVEECVDLTGARVFGEDEIIASTGIGLPANARMSMLRGALQGEPTRAGWNHAVAVLEAWPDAQGVEDAIRYAADLTAEWPREVCVASHRWIKRSAQAAAKRMALAGSLEVRNGDDLRSVLRALDGAPRLEAITFRLVGHWFFPSSIVEAVLRHPRGRLVRSIVLDAPIRGSGSDAARDALLKTPLPRLERLHVRRPPVVPAFDRDEQLELRARTPAVRAFDLEGTPLWEQ